MVYPWRKGIGRLGRIPDVGALCRLPLRQREVLTLRLLLELDTGTTARTPTPATVAKATVFIPSRFGEAHDSSIRGPVFQFSRSPG